MPTCVQHEETETGQRSHDEMRKILPQGTGTHVEYSAKRTPTLDAPWFPEVPHQKEQESPIDGERVGPIAHAHASSVSYIILEH